MMSSIEEYCSGQKRGQATYLPFEAALLVLLFVPIRISWLFFLSIPDLQEDVLE